MPELPEVETVARGLRSPLIGRSIVDVTLRWPRTIGRPGVKEFADRIIGQRVESVGRRGKYVVIGLDRDYLLVHLMMSGRLQVVSSDEPLDKHVHLFLDLDGGSQLRFRDVRKFGRVYLVRDPDEVTAGLGPEPLVEGFTVDEFRRLLAPRRGRIKPLLLNQQFLAGLGNIYADEALFASQIHPLRTADSLSMDEQARLYQSIRTVLSRAIERRGTTLSDGGYADASGRAGGYQAKISVYGRSGEPCLRCQTSIERLVIGGRSAHFCPHCQEKEGP